MEGVMDRAGQSDLNRHGHTDPIHHRDTVVAVDAGVPAHTIFAENNEGFAAARVYCKLSFKGGTNPAPTLRAWVKHRGKHVDTPYVGGLLYVDANDSVGGVARQPFAVVGPAGDGWFAFDVPVDGDDLFVELQSASGTPTSFTFDCWLTWGP